jgi:uncharacterized protein
MKNITVMLKPASSACNMRCRYCFYADVSSLRDCPSYGIMSAEVRERVIKNIFAGLKPGDRLNLAFQGGEPTLAGLPWFRALAEQVKELSRGIRVVGEAQLDGRRAHQVNGRGGDHLDRRDVGDVPRGR